MYHNYPWNFIRLKPALYLVSAVWFLLVEVLRSQKQKCPLECPCSKNSLSLLKNVFLDLETVEGCQMDSLETVLFICTRGQVWMGIQASHGLSKGRHTVCSTLLYCRHCYWSSRLYDLPMQSVVSWEFCVEGLLLCWDWTQDLPCQTSALPQNCIPGSIRSLESRLFF